MELSEAVVLKLISEIKKPGRECLYDLSNSSYKNNHIKQNVWSEVAKSVGIGRNECQTQWKSLRRRHKTAINKNKGKTGSERLEIKGFSKLLLTEMDYFLNFNEDKEPTAVNSSSSSTSLPKKCFQQTKKRIKLDEAEEEYKDSIKSLNSLTAAVLQASTSKRDPFFSALEDEFARVPENRKSALKLKLMTLVIENQE